MTVRWITDRLGTSPWVQGAASSPFGIVDVRLLRDASGNSPALIQGKIAEARAYLAQGKSVVICCDYGISRSNAIAAAVLAADADISLDEGFRRVIRATGETGIKIDLVEDLRLALNVDKRKASGPLAFILGSDGFIGRSLLRNLDPAISAFISNDQALIDNPVLLDAAMEEATADRLLFTWHPAGLDTNRAAGQLITALRNALEVCRVRHAALIFLSGQQIFSGYGQTSRFSCSEATPPMPTGAAGDGLFLAETLVRQYELRHGLTTLIVRPTHVYGPGDQRPGIVNTLIRKALSQQEMVTHRFRNGAPFLDLLHVKDLAQAIGLAIEKHLSGVLHIASGTPVTTDELARMLVRLTGSSSAISSIEMPRNYNMAHLESMIADPVLGWRPRIDLAAGLSELIDQTHTNAPLEQT
jgi:nucleoside-diphosphate-sugar epimerase